jgi:hypothetical protein
MPIKVTKPEAFIIESLTFEDENLQRFEGSFLSQILHLAGKEPKYYYIRTEKELRKILKLFQQSDYRYLHISCHGSKKSIYTTLDEIPFSRFVN